MNDSIWNKTLLSIKNIIDPLPFNTWFSNIEFIDIQDDKLRLCVPYLLYKTHIEQNYKEIIIDNFNNNSSFKINDIIFILKENLNEILDKEKEKTETKDDVDKYKPKKAINSNLNKNYTFDTFVVGSNNILAHDTSLAVAESPGGIYNPLFIYGGVGLGKTHLMQSIGHFVLNKNPNAKVLYTTSESFTNELIETLRNKSGNQQEMSDFRAKYRNVDVLLIDDIQFLQKKESTQEEFFHTFQYLYMHKKAIVISSDRKPKDLEGLEDRLVNRFESGLTVDIQSPNYETRMAILKKKVEVEGIDIPNDVLDYISTNVIFNIRELEGSLTKIIAFSKISNQTIDLDFAKDVLKDYISPEEDNTITCKKIIEVVADHFGISPNDLASKKRSKEIAYARQVCMYICKTLTDETNKKIGLALHKDNPSTVIYGVNQIKEEMARDINTKNMVEVIIKKLNTK